MTSRTKGNDFTMTCWQMVKGEFQVQNFLLHYSFPEEFHRAQCGVSILYLFWRFLWAVYHLSSIPVIVYLMELEVARPENMAKEVIYYTYWALLLLIVTVIWDLIMSFDFYFQQKHNVEGQKRSPWYINVFWVLANVSNAAAVHVSITYWTLLHRYRTGFNILTFLSHGMNVIYVILNLLVTAMPVRLLHFYQPALFAMFHLVFNAIYVIAGGTNVSDKPYIYHILDWNKSPEKAAGTAAVGGIIGTIAAHIVVYMIYLFRSVAFKNKQCSSQ